MKVSLYPYLKIILIFSLVFNSLTTVFPLLAQQQRSITPQEGRIPENSLTAFELFHMITDKDPPVVGIYDLLYPRIPNLPLPNSEYFKNSTPEGETLLQEMANIIEPLLEQDERFQFLRNEGLSFQQKFLDFLKKDFKGAQYYWIVNPFESLSQLAKFDKLQIQKNGRNKQTNQQARLNALQETITAFGLPSGTDERQIQTDPSQRQYFERKYQHNLDTEVRTPIKNNDRRPAKFYYIKYEKIILDLILQNLKSFSERAKRMNFNPTIFMKEPLNGKPTTLKLLKHDFDFFYIKESWNDLLLSQKAPRIVKESNGKQNDLDPLFSDANSSKPIAKQFEILKVEVPGVNIGWFRPTDRHIMDAKGFSLFAQKSNPNDPAYLISLDKILHLLYELQNLDILYPIDHPLHHECIYLIEAYHRHYFLTYLLYQLEDRYLESISSSSRGGSQNDPGLFLEKLLNFFSNSRTATTSPEFSSLTEDLLVYGLPKELDHTSQSSQSSWWTGIRWWGYSKSPVYWLLKSHLAIAKKKVHIVEKIVQLKDHKFDKIELPKLEKIMRIFDPFNGLTKKSFHHFLNGSQKNYYFKHPWVHSTLFVAYWISAVVGLVSLVILPFVHPSQNDPRPSDSTEIKALDKKSEPHISSFEYIEKLRKTKTFFIKPKETTIEEIPKLFYYPDEEQIFSNELIKKPLSIPNSPYPSYAFELSTVLVQTSEYGVVPIPTPEGFDPVSIEVQNNYETLSAGRDYGIFSIPQMGQSYIKFNGNPKDITNYKVSFSVKYKKASQQPNKNRLLFPLRHDLVQEIAQTLKMEGFKSIASTIETKITSNQHFSFLDFTNSISFSSVYTYQPLNFWTELTHLTPDKTVFSPFRKYVDGGVYYGQCTGGNAINTVAIDHYLKKANLNHSIGVTTLPAYVFDTTVVDAISSNHYISLSGHLTTLVYSKKSEEPNWIHLDATPKNTDTRTFDNRNVAPTKRPELWMEEQKKQIPQEKNRPENSDFNTTRWTLKPEQKKSNINNPPDTFLPKQTEDLQAERIRRSTVLNRLKTARSTLVQSMKSSSISIATIKDLQLSTDLRATNEIQSYLQEEISSQELLSRMSQIFQTPLDSTSSPQEFISRLFGNRMSSFAKIIEQAGALARKYPQHKNLLLNDQLMQEYNNFLIFLKTQSWLGKELPASQSQPAAPSAPIADPHRRSCRVLL